MLIVYAYRGGASASIGNIVLLLPNSVGVELDLMCTHALTE